MDKALNDLLMSAAAKALGQKQAQAAPTSTIKKADPGKYYATYDLSLGEFYVPGRNRRETASEEQKMMAGLKMLAEKLQKENAALRKQGAEDKARAHKDGLTEGRSLGFVEGYEKGKTDNQSAVAQVQKNITASLKAFEARKDEILNKSERKSLEIIFQAVEHILRLEAQTRKEVVLNILKTAIAEVSKSDTVTIKINPAEIAAVNAARDFWLPVNAQIKDVKVVEDSRVERGGCVVESSSGSVDARLPVQIEKIREIFLKCWEDGIGSVT